MYDFSNHTAEQLEQRSAEILALLEQPEANLTELQAEARALHDEMELRAQAAADAERRAAVANGAGTVVRTFEREENHIMERMRIDSPEYREAFLRTLNFEELEPEVRAAFVATTGNTTAPLPTTMVDRIWDLVYGEHCILGDITIYRTGTILEVVKHTAITQGKAKKVNENAANDDESNTFVKVVLSGHDFSKHVDVSYAFGLMAIDALEDYLVTEISKGISEAMSADCVTQIESDMATENKVNTAGVGNVVFKDVAALFAKIKGANGLVLYATRETIYTHLVGMVDNNGRPIFQLNAQDDAEGVLIGAKVKVEDAVPAGKLLLGDGKQVVGNVVQDVMIESDRDIKKHVITHSGYARAEFALVHPKAFAELTVKTT